MAGEFYGLMGSGLGAMGLHGRAAQAQQRAARVAQADIEHWTPGFPGHDQAVRSYQEYLLAAGRAWQQAGRYEEAGTAFARVIQDTGARQRWNSDLRRLALRGHYQALARRGLFPFTPMEAEWRSQVGKSENLSGHGRLPTGFNLPHLGLRDIAWSLFSLPRPEMVVGLGVDWTPIFEGQRDGPLYGALVHSGLAMLDMRKESPTHDAIHALDEGDLMHLKDRDFRIADTQVDRRLHEAPRFAMGTTPVARMMLTRPEDNRMNALVLNGMGIDQSSFSALGDLAPRVAEWRHNLAVDVLLGLPDQVDWQGHHFAALGWTVLVGGPHSMVGQGSNFRQVGILGFFDPQHSDRERLVPVTEYQEDLAREEPRIMHGRNLRQIRTIENLVVVGRAAEFYHRSGGHRHRLTARRGV